MFGINRQMFWTTLVSVYAVAVISQLVPALSPGRVAGLLPSFGNNS